MHLSLKLIIVRNVKTTKQNLNTYRDYTTAMSIQVSCTNYQNMDKHTIPYSTKLPVLPC